MADFKTPGVYVQEISKLPASVAPVATAIPAFVGYTQKAVKKEEDVTNLPVRITSLLEYEEVFGKAFDEQFVISLEDNNDSDVPKVETSGSTSPYLMFYSLQLYFANGGGPCYVVSVGNYDEQPEDSSIVAADLVKGVNILDFEDEPTLLVVPESVILGVSGAKPVYEALLKQCADLKDRFALFDVLVGNDKNPYQDAVNFRGQTGMDHLSYGGAYYPSLKTLIKYSYNEENLLITDNRSVDEIASFNNYSLQNLKEGYVYELAKIVVTDVSLLADGDKIVINGKEFEFSAGTEAGKIEIKNQSIGTAVEVSSVIGTDSDFLVERPTGKNFVWVKLASIKDDNPPLDVSFDGDPNALTITTEQITSAGKAVYNQIKKSLDNKRLTLYPSSAMAGVYARVDRNRGVWKAPANVSLNMVDEPVVLVTDEDQAPLNVDATTGKSINVIRKFHQKGTLVWGARTLAGNDNEWRYIPVRRLFIFMEESLKKATEPVVFEPNNANTWSKTKAMIESFLTGIWRDGALAGATEADAFFVRVGLGQTMSPIDVLEGRLIIEIGVAAVRPAEFIILKFMHKLQES